ncbi:hypothetical protein GOP47_0026224 [Adiantum capillus-veneris]|nr:hypothetical protein GOP47_0026224 [Adiantum capillus-veneris]
MVKKNTCCSNCSQLKAMEVEEKEDGMKAVLQSSDIVAVILNHLSSPQDVLSASAVCRFWRLVLKDPANLQSWVLDDTVELTPGLKMSSTPLLPKTPPPKLWIDPTTYSPLASFKTPKSLLPRDRYYDQSSTPTSKLLNIFHCKPHSDKCNSPRTPSPIRETAIFPPLLHILKEKMVMGRFLGDIDIMSSRMNDKCMQVLLERCPHLQTLRLVHTCTLQLKESSESLSSMKYESLHQTSCSCSLLTNTAFAGIHRHCPELVSVTLILQHVTFRTILRKILMELGRLPKLQTLSIELRVPSFGQSTKSKVIWDSHVRVTEQEIFALIQVGPPPLRALALNRCDLTGASMSTLACACPDIEALELHSDFEDTKEEFFLQRVPSNLLELASLSAAAFGVLMNVETCRFDKWRMLALKRLRLESKKALTVEQLQLLKGACPQLESVHLIWNSVHGMNETHLYPFVKETFSAYSLASLQ